MADAEIIAFPGVEGAVLIVDRDGDVFVLEAVNRPPISGLPQQFPSMIEAASEGVAVGLENGLSVLITSAAMVWELERKIGPKP